MRPYIRIVEHPDGRRVFRVQRKYLERLVREIVEEEENSAAPEETEPKPGKKQRQKVDTSTADVGAADAPEVPDTEDPADDEIEADTEGEPTKGRLSDELVGKTVQSVTMEPKSKLIPGAQEIVLTFNEITDPLRILVAKTGKISFFFRNSLHNLV